MTPQEIQKLQIALHRQHLMSDIILHGVSVDFITDWLKIEEIPTSELEHILSELIKSKMVKEGIKFD